MLIRDAMCGAGYGERRESGPTTATATGAPGFDTCAGSMDVAIPKLRCGSYFPDWLVQHRKRRTGPHVGGNHLLPTGSVDRLVESLGVTSLSKSQVSIMAKEVDEAVGRFAPSARRRTVHIRRRRLAGAQGP
jgi:putative transposase